ncbi:tape measure protein [Anaerosolibacter sp.]|uniref:tape measure protein n=1 Tax=Anaerosolibacter sp. TaxID=1872527 RepID=UPI0039EF96AB
MIVRELLTRLGFTLDMAKARQADATIDGIRTKANATVGAVFRIGAALGVAFSARAILETADAWKAVQGRIAMTTDSIAEQEKIMESLYNVAQDTRQEFTATADLFQKVNRSSKEIGVSQGEILRLTENINKALTIGGGKTQENQAAILQFGQALASGRLQGDELRSILENAPRLAMAIAEGLGVSIGKLREMGADGELTAKTIVGAILSQTDKLNAEFKKAPLTVGQGMTYARNAFGRFIRDIEKDTRVFDRLARGIIRFTDLTIGGLNKAAKAVGGWNRLLRITGIIIASLAAGFLAYKWAAIVTAATTAFKGLAVVLTNPTFLAVAAIFAVILLLIEDLYTWLNGGKSVIGSWLESMGISAEEFKNGFGMAVEFVKNVFLGLWSLLQILFGAFIDLIKYFIAIWIGDFESAEESAKAILQGLYDFFAQLLGYFGIDLDEITEKFIDVWDTAVEKVKGFFTSLFVWGSEKINGLIDIANKLPLIDIPKIPIPSAGSAGRPGNSINQQVSIANSFGSGMPAEQAQYVATAAEKNYKSNYGQLSRALKFGSTQ